MISHFPKTKINLIKKHFSQIFLIKPSIPVSRKKGASTPGIMKQWWDKAINSLEGKQVPWAYQKKSSSNKERTEQMTGSWSAKGQWDCKPWSHHISISSMEYVIQQRTQWSIHTFGINSSHACYMNFDQFSLIILYNMFYRDCGFRITKPRIWAR